MPRSRDDNPAVSDANPTSHAAPAMTRGQLADAIWEGRMSIAEAEVIDPTLKGVRAIFGISDEEARQRHNLAEADDIAPDTPGYRYVDEVVHDPAQSEHDDGDDYSDAYGA